MTKLFLLVLLLSKPKASSNSILLRTLFLSNFNSLTLLSRTLVSVLNWVVKSLKSNGTFDTGISDFKVLPPTASNLKFFLLAACVIPE